MTIEEVYNDGNMVRGRYAFGIEIVNIVRWAQDDWVFRGMPYNSEYRAERAYRVYFADGSMVLLSNRTTVNE